MYDKAPRSPLLSSPEITTGSSITFKLPEDPIQQYNYVVQLYNIDENLINQTKLEQIPLSNLHYQFWKIFSNPCSLFIFLVAIAAPGLGLILYMWLSAGIVVYLKGSTIVNRNKSKVPDPFQNMVFAPELCRITGSIHKFYEVKLRDLEGFSFNSEVIANLKLKTNGESLKFMVYNGKFWDYYNNFSKYRVRYILTWLTASVFLAIQAVLIKIIIQEGF